MRTAATVIFSLAAICFLGCSWGVRPFADEIPEGRELPIVWEKAGAQSHIARPLRLVIHDPANLAKAPIADVPVDFSKEMVLIAAMGPTRSSTAKIRIARIWREGNELRVRVDSTYPNTPGADPMLAASPYHIVVVPRSEMNVSGFTTRVPNDVIRYRKGQ